MHTFQIYTQLFVVHYRRDLKPHEDIKANRTKLENYVMSQLHCNYLLNTIFNFLKILLHCFLSS